MYAASRAIKSNREAKKEQEQFKREMDAENRRYEKEKGLVQFRFDLEQEALEDRLEREKAAKEAEIQRKNTVFDFGYVLKNGKRSGELVMFDPTEGHKRDQFETSWLRFGDGAPEKIEDNPEYTPFYIDKVNGGFLDNYPSDKKDDYVFGGYRVKGTELISYTPLAEGFLKKLGEGVESVDITSTGFQYETPDGKVHNTRVEATTHLGKKATKDFLEDNNLEPIIVRIETVETKRDGTVTKSTVKRSDITPLRQAAEKAAKGPPLFSVPYLDAEKKLEFYPGTSLDPTEDLRSFNTQLGENFANSQDYIEQLDPAKYRDFLSNVAARVVSVTTTVDNNNVPQYNVYLKRDAKAFIESNYSNIAKMPGIVAALQFAIGQAEKRTLDAALQDFTAQGQNTRIITKELPPKVKNDPTQPDQAVIVTPENPKYTDAFEQMKAILVKQGVEPKDIDTFFSEEVTDHDDTLQVVLPEQPKADFINFLFANRVAKTGRLFYDVFAGAMNKKSNAYSRVEQRVMGQFLESYGTLDDKVNLIKMVSPNLSGTNTASLMYAVTTGKSEASYGDFKEDKEAQSAAYKTADGFLGGFISTYYDSDGKLIPYPARIGELKVALDGAFYIFDELVKPALRNLVPGIDAAKTLTAGEETAEALRDSMFGSNRQFRSFSDLTLAEKQAEAKKRGVPLAQYEAAEAKARKELEAMFDEQVVTKAKDEATMIKLAMRSYSRFMSAYALASATQGGTGGRTISDQDVLNFLKAFNNNKLLSSAKVEVEILKRIQTEVQQQAAIAGKIAAGGHDATATLKLLSIPGAALNLTMDDLGRKVGVDMDFADKPDEDAEVSTDAPVQTDAPYSKDDFSKIIASRAGSGFLVPFNLDEGPGGANITNVEDLIESGQLTRDDANRLLGRQ